MLSISYKEYIAVQRSSFDIYRRRLKKTLGALVLTLSEPEKRFG